MESKFKWSCAYKRLVLVGTRVCLAAPWASPVESNAPSCEVAGRRTQAVLHHGHRWEELLGGVAAHWLLRYLLPPLLGVGNSPAVRVDSLLQSQLLLSLPEHVPPGLVEVSVELVTVRGFMVTCRSTRKQAQEIN